VFCFWCPILPEKRFQKGKMPLTDCGHKKNHAHWAQPTILSTNRFDEKDKSGFSTRRCPQVQGNVIAEQKEGRHGQWIGVIPRVPLNSFVKGQTRLNYGCKIDSQKLAIVVNCFPTLAKTCEMNSQIGESDL
jgi:hypothetical protein